jgi:hypothetical protein
LAAVASVAAHAEPATAAPVTQHPTADRSVSDFGARGDGHDDTAALRSALEWASAAAVPRAILFPPGIYAVESLEVPPQVRLVGQGGGSSRYPVDGAYGGATIVPAVDSVASGPLVTLAGPGTPGGAVLEDLVVDGRNFRTAGLTTDRSTWAARTGIAVDGGFEAELRRVRVIRFRGIGIDVRSLNNARWETVFVDLCGSSSQPAMRVRSPEDGATNFVVFDSLTIERSADTALALAVGTDPRRDWVSNLTFTGLHVESTLDTPGVALNSGALIDIGNVRAVTFLVPQIVGAPAPIVRYRQQIPADATVVPGPGGDVRDQQGGVAIVGGHLHQHSGSNSRVAAVHVTGNGRGFSASGVRFAHCVAPAVRIDESFRFDATVLGCSVRTQSGVERVVDERSDEAALRHWATQNHGDFSVTRDADVRGDVRVGRALELGTAITAPDGTDESAPTVESPEPGNTAVGWAERSSRGPGSDLLGEVWWRHSKRASADLVRVRFAQPKHSAPAVLLTPRKSSTARLPIYVELEREGPVWTGFVLRSADPCPAGPDTHVVEYLVLDRR